MHRRNLYLLAALALLSACSSSHRPTYSGRQESTEGVPGFVNGKKVSPHVKLGQSYTVDGETYVPRHEPGYMEEGMASWYGPGFHGGKTANGERFDASELTAAHRTLPLPSIVRVTLLSTGKTAVVRVNDRGPFAHSRIIDLSRGAAEKIGLIRVGVGKVRVEYMEKESERFAKLMANGRDPKEIDIASEVLTYDVPDDQLAVAQDDTVNSNSAPISQVVSSDLAAPTGSAPAIAASAPLNTGDSPFDAMREGRTMAATAPASKAVDGTYVQLGAFKSEANARNLLKRYEGIKGLQVTPKNMADGQTLYHVRMGPYGESAAVEQAVANLQAAGAEPRIVRE